MSSVSSGRRSGRALLALLLFASIPSTLLAQSSGLPLTRAERTNYQETTRYDEVMEFLREVTARSPDLHLTTMGYTTEGRPIPLVVAGRVSDPGPEGVKATGKTRLYIQAGIHAGEINGKEAMLILLRELSNGDHAQWADSLVLLIDPLYNADGNERMSLYNRRAQHGPVGGMGQRANAQGYDLNRDQMKLDAPESRSLVRLYTLYDPHLSVDIHTTNGSHHGYHLTYSPPLTPNTPPEIDEFMRGEWLPEVTREVKEETGFDTYYYGGPRRGPPGTQPGWYTFSHMPRYVSNYIGLRNRFGILEESYSYATFEERIQVSYWFTRKSIDFAYQHASEIRRRTEAADARSLVGDSLALTAVPQRSDQPVTILMGEVTEETNPYTGEVMLRRTDTQVPTQMYEYGTFQPTEWARVPAAYYIPPELGAAAELVQAHGLRTRVLDEPMRMDAVEGFMVDSVSSAGREYEGHTAQTVVGAYGTRTGVTLEAGTVVVPMDQPLARVAFKLLEPRSDDGLVAWGLLTRQLAAGELYPILRAGPGMDPGPGPE